MSLRKFVDEFLDKDAQLKLTGWLAGKDTKRSGATGGRFTYEFTPTTLGTVIKVKDNLDKTTIDLTDYESW